jgi:hypothetical protein
MAGRQTNWILDPDLPEAAGAAESKGTNAFISVTGTLQSTAQQILNISSSSATDAAPLQHVVCNSFIVFRFICDV